MRITAHSAIALEPFRTTPIGAPAHAPARTTGPSVPTGAVKPTFQTKVPTTSTDPFASVFQAFTQNSAASSTGSTATTGATSSGSTATTSVQTPGIQALIAAIMNGTFQPSYVTSPSQLTETNPLGTAIVSNFNYLSDQTANQLAQLLGGTVVKAQPFGQDIGWTEPYANFIQLPNGQTFNAADVAYYARNARSGDAQLTADLTQTINIGAAWTKWYQTGGSMPVFPTGYIGPPISGMTYPAGSIGVNGMVINPATLPANPNT